MPANSKKIRNLVKPRTWQDRASKELYNGIPYYVLSKYVLFPVIPAFLCDLVFWGGLSGELYNIVMSALKICWAILKLAGNAAMFTSFISAMGLTFIWRSITGEDWGQGDEDYWWDGDDQDGRKAGKSKALRDSGEVQFLDKYSDESSSSDRGARWGRRHSTGERGRVKKKRTMSYSGSRRNTRR